jgi:hypothetical protein
VDFLLTAKRDRKAALRFLRKAIKWNGTPEKITIDKSGANTAAIESHNAEHEAGIEIRQVKYFNNIVEQDYQAIKRLVRPMLGFKSFRSGAVTLAGIELMHMIRKGHCCRQAKCVQHEYSIVGGIKPVISIGDRMLAQEICDKTGGARRGDTNRLSPARLLKCRQRPGSMHRYRPKRSIGLSDARCAPNR